MPIPQINLSEDNQRKLVARLKEMTEAAEEFHSSWEDLHKIYWQQYFCQPDSETRTFPWRGASNVFVPLGRIIQDGIMSQLHDAMFANDPVVKVKAETSRAMRRSDILSRFYGDYVFKKIVPLRKVGNDWNFMALLDGTGIARVRWDRDRRLKRIVQATMTPVYEEVEQVDFMGTQAEWPSRIVALQETVDERVTVERREQPVWEVVDTSRLRIAPDTVSGLQYPECPWYYIVKDLTWEELLTRKREGYANIDDELLARLSHRSPDDIERMRRENQEVSEGTVLKTAEALEFYMRLVLPAEYADGEETRSQDYGDENGYEEEVVVTYLPATEKIARIVPLYRVSPDGRRPDIPSHYAGGIPFRFYGQGIQSKMRHLNAAMNSGANQMIDYGTLQNMPFYFYVPHLAQMPDLASIVPGQGIPVGDPRGVQFPRMNGDMSFWLNLNSFLQSYAERDGTITDQTLGRLPEKSANKTYRGMALVQQLANVGFRRVAGLMSLPYVEALNATHNRYRRHAPAEIVFRVTGERGGDFEDMRISRYELDREVEFEMVLNPDRQQETQTAQALFQLVTSIPYIAQNPASVRAAAKHLYETIGSGGGVRNFEEIWPEQMTQQIIMQQQSQAQQQAMMQGRPGQPMPVQQPPPQAQLPPGPPQAEPSPDAMPTLREVDEEMGVNLE